MTDVTDKVRAALEYAEYALDRAVLFKPPQSSQREVELSALATVKQALRELEGHVIVPVEPTDADIDRMYPLPDTWSDLENDYAKAHRQQYREKYRAMIAPYVKGEA